MLGGRRRWIRGLSALLTLGAVVAVLALGAIEQRTGEAGSPATQAPEATEAPEASDTALVALAAAQITGAVTGPATLVVRRRYVFPLKPSAVAGYSSGGHAYPATDVFVPLGTRFLAVTSGVIESVNRVDAWDPVIDDGANRGGRWVSLIGDDGIRYYGSHFSRIATRLAPGDRVAAGQVLAYVGVAGNARGTPAHVHFGLSCPGDPDDWEARRGELDPVPYLDAWRAGVWSSPADRYRCPSPRDR